MTFSRIAVLLVGTMLAVPAAARDHTAKSQQAETGPRHDIIVTGTKSADPFGAKSGIPLAQIPPSDGHHNDRRLYSELVETAGSDHRGCGDHGMVGRKGVRYPPILC